MTSHDNRQTGSRYLYEPFVDHNCHLELLERLFEEKIAVINERLDRIDRQTSQLDRRLWVGCFGVVMVLLTKAIIGILIYAG